MDSYTDYRKSRGEVITYYNSELILFTFFHSCFALATLGLSARGSVAVKALCYKLEGRDFETR
jgi:hypothetical protein